eukprot:803652-Pelagomonas_calceolata.AAC.3
MIHVWSSLYFRLKPVHACSRFATTHPVVHHAHQAFIEVHSRLDTPVVHNGHQLCLMLPLALHAQLPWPEAGPACPGKPKNCEAKSEKESLVNSKQLPWPEAVPACPGTSVRPPFVSAGTSAQPPSAAAARPAAAPLAPASMVYR